MLQWGSLVSHEYTQNTNNHPKRHTKKEQHKKEAIPEATEALRNCKGAERMVHHILKDWSLWQQQRHQS